jgi:hypothetical protein
MSFKEVALAMVAEEVLGVTLSVPYTIDPALDATISFEVADRMSPAQLLGAFEASLAEQQIAMVRSGGGLTLSPAKVAASPEVAPSPSPSVTGPPSATGQSPAPTGSNGSLLAASGGALVGALAMLAFRRRRWPSVGSGSMGGPSRRLVANSPQRALVLQYLLAQAEPHPAALARAELIARRANRPLEQVLSWTGLVTEAALAEAYAAVSNLPLWTPEVTAPVEVSGSRRRLLQMARFVLLSDDGESATVATDDPFDDEAVGRLAAALKRVVSLQVATAAHIDQALELAITDAGGATPIAQGPVLALLDSRPSEAAAEVHHA